MSPMSESVSVSVLSPHIVSTTHISESTRGESSESTSQRVNPQLENCLTQAANLEGPFLMGEVRGFASFFS